MRSNQKGRILAAKGGVFPPKNSWSNGDLRERETERERERLVEKSTSIDETFTMWI